VVPGGSARRPAPRNRSGSLLSRPMSPGLQWIEERDWEYRPFSRVTAGCARPPRIELVARRTRHRGHVWLNGPEVAPYRKHVRGLPLGREIPPARRPERACRIRFASATGLIRTQRSRAKTEGISTIPSVRCTVIRKQTVEFGGIGPELARPAHWQRYTARGLEWQSGGKNRVVAEQRRRRRGTQASLPMSSPGPITR